METPKQIYLQIETEAYVHDVEKITIEHLGDATWCVDRIHESDVEYVRRDVAVDLREMVDDLMCYAIDAGRRADYDRGYKLWRETAWIEEDTDGST